MPASTRTPGPREFTTLLALSMSLAALGVDMLLPVFGVIRDELGLAADSTAVAGLITAYFVGLAMGQLVYGPVSDRYGRRPVLFAGYALYAVGALASILAPTLTSLLIARVLWGIGAAGPRVVTLAAIRDRYSGEQMSRAMSFVMAVFILVPVVAPTLGAAIAAVLPWRAIFGFCLLATLAVFPWAYRRLPETLAPQDRLPLEAARIARAFRMVVANRQTLAYTLALTSLYGVFISYLASSEIIFGDTFGIIDAYPLVFGGLAAVMGVAILVNARVVERVGTRRLAHTVLVAYLVVAAGLVTMSLITGGRPPLAVFMVGVALMLSAHALLIPNFNTLAMEPMGEIAGTASSVIGAVQIAVGAGLGALLDRQFDGTVLPLSLGFLGYGVVAAALVAWTDRDRLFAGPMVTTTSEDALAPEAAVTA